MRSIHQLPTGDKYVSTGPRTVLYLDHTAKWSGGEIALLRLLTALDRTKYRPVVVLAEHGPLVQHLEQINVTVSVHPLDDNTRNVRKEALNFGGIARRLITDGVALIRYAQQIAAIAEAEDATLIHCNSLKSDIYGVIAGRMKQIPVIWHVRDFIDPSYLPITTVSLFRNIARWCPAHIFTNSKATLTCLFPQQKDRQRATVVYNGLTEYELRSPLRSYPYTWRGRSVIRLGMVGRIARWKGQHIVVEAIKLLEAERSAGHLPAGTPPFEVLFAGDSLFGEDSYLQELKDAAESVAYCTQWLGMVKDIPAFLQSLDIMIHASITPEPFGQVVIEGMAAGVPVIATAGGGVPEIIENGRTGLLIPMGDASALAGAVKKLLCRPDLAACIGTNGYKTVHSRFTARDTADVVEKMYEQIIGNTIHCK